MVRPSDPKKLALWQSRFQRFSSSRLAVARFCAMEHVSVASFYYWRKKLGPRALRNVASGREHDVFQPVTVVPAGAGVSISWPGGAQIEVGAEHLDAIRAVIAEVARVERDQEVERSSFLQCQTHRDHRGVASC